MSARVSSPLSGLGQKKKRSPRGLMDLTGALLCLWAAAYHTPVGALLRDLGGRLTSTRTTTRPLLAYYTGGVYDAQDIAEPTPGPAPVPDVEVLTTVPPGRALGRGVFAAASTLTGLARAPVDALAKRYGLPFGTPDEAALVIEHARVDLGSEEAAVLAVFAGYDVAAYAARRSGAEGRATTLEALTLNLPPSSSGAIASASTALMLGTAYSLSWPVAPGTRVTSPFGWRNHPILGRGQFHTGVDLSVPEGTDVKVVADGVVRRASEDAVNGRVVIIDHGRGVSTAYCHNSRLLVTTGQRVKAGDVIAESGTTGRSTGPHVHYQLELGHKPMDPFTFRGSKPTLVDPLAVLPPTPAPTPLKPAAPSPTNGKDQLKKAFDQFGAPPDSEE
ncbi:MAG: M23 family metallopeptidase [Myxococcaceae bacterium]